MSHGNTQITLAGNLVADPELRATRTGEAFTSLRLAVTPRVYVRGEHEGWADGPTSFYRVAAFGALATNVLNCVRKGEPVVVSGHLTIRDWETGEGQPRRDAQVTAEWIGHNLRLGRSEFRRETRPVLDAVDDAQPGVDEESDADLRGGPGEPGEPVAEPYTLVEQAG